jgi:hypothetical protein
MNAVDYRQPPAKKLLVATALLTRDHATVVPFDCGGYHATALSRANGDTARADPDSYVRITTVAIAIITVAPELNIDALGLDRNSERSSRQHRYGCRRDDTFRLGSRIVLAPGRDSHYIVSAHWPRLKPRVRGAFLRAQVSPCQMLNPESVQRSHLGLTGGIKHAVAC